MDSEDRRRRTFANRLTIQQLLADYAWSADLRDAGAIGDLYAEDATMSFDVAGGSLAGPYEGRQAIVDFAASTFAEQRDRRRHVLTNVRFVAEDEHRVSVTAYLTLLVTADDAVSVRATGVYHVDLAVDGDRWLIRRVHLTLDGPF